MATLVYSDVDGVDRSFPLGSDPVVVGRAAECAIRSDDPRVSRMHARFYLEQGILWVGVTVLSWLCELRFAWRAPWADDQGPCLFGW